MVARNICVCIQIQEEIDKFGIKVYQFPECDSDEDEEFKQLDKELKVSVCSQTCRLLLLTSSKQQSNDFLCSRCEEQVVVWLLSLSNTTLGL